MNEHVKGYPALPYQAENITSTCRSMVFKQELNKMDVLFPLYTLNQLTESTALQV